MLNNVKKRSKKAVSGDNNGTRLAPKVCLPVDYSRDIATLVFLYFRNIERIQKMGVTPDPSWAIFDDFEDELLNGVSPSSDIPGYRPIGYAHGKSPVRERTIGEVSQAIMILQDENPEAHAILVNQLYEKSGKELDAEWNRIAKLHQTAQEYRARAESYEALARYDKRVGADPTRHERIGKGYRMRLAKIESTAGRDSMPLYHQVLDASALLKPYLW